MHKIPGRDTPVSNENVVNLYGEVTLTTADTERFIGPNSATAVPAFPADTGELIEVASANVGDAGNVRLEGLGADLCYLEEVIALGATSTKPFARINKIVWLEETKFLGVISATNVGGLTTFCTADPSAQLTAQAVLSIPKDKEWQVRHVYAAITRDANQAASALISIYLRPIGRAFTLPFKFSAVTNGSSSTDHPNVVPSQLPGGMDFYVSASATAIAVEVVTNISVLQVDD